MTLLKDDELQAMLVTGRQVINVPAPRDWDGRESPVQPASFDLHVGDIHIPRTRADERGGLTRPLHDYSLEPGETVVVTTAEILQLNGDITGFGFPPSHVSFRGILMTNPGHIDPGYAGPPRFAVINMGSEAYPLRQGDVIVTVLFVRLTAAARRDWRARNNGQPAAGLIQEDLDRLSRDFLNINERAREIASNAVKSAAFVGPIWAAVIVAALALLGSTLTAFGPLGWKDQVAEVRREVAEIRKSVEVEQLKGKIDQLEKAVQRLQPAGPKR